MADDAHGPGDEPIDLLPARDAAAFEHAFNIYLDPLCRYVNTYVHSWETAEELVNDVFLQLWRRLGGSEPVRELKAYLYTSARHHALNLLKRRNVEARHRQRERETADASPSVLSHVPDAEQQLAARELVAAVHRAVDTLPPRQRDVILLKWERQASNAEIADLLGIEPTTVAVHFRRAVASLRSTLPRLLRGLR